MRGLQQPIVSCMDNAEKSICWNEVRSRSWIAVPGAGDDKYARGVLGVMTGSQEFPGAAVLGVAAAMRTGIGMVRYIGPERPTRLVLERRPEVVSTPGRVQAWLVGSGMDAADRDESVTTGLRKALAEGTPVVIDAGALDLVDEAAGPVVITPHFRELARMFGLRERNVTAEEIKNDPAGWASRAADVFGVTVLLKGHVTYVARPETAADKGAPGSWPRLVAVPSGPSWLATAGTGDVLGGILGAVLATHAAQVAEDARALVPLAATAVHIHGLAASRASAGAPIVALDVADAVQASIRELLSRS